MNLLFKEMDYCYLRKKKSSFARVRIKTSYDAYRCISRFYQDDMEIYESFFILLLNRVNDTIGYSKISQGGTCSTVVDVKILCKIAVDALADSVVLAHNHPSGCLVPSDADKKVTDMVINALEHFDIRVVDHIIISSNGFFSFRDNGLIK